MTHSHIKFSHSGVLEGDMGIALIVPLSLPAFKKIELLPTPKKTLAFHPSNPKETIYFMSSLITFFDIGKIFGIVLIDCSLYRNTDQFDYSKLRTIYTSERKLPKVHLINAS